MKAKRIVNIVVGRGLKYYGCPPEAYDFLKGKKLRRLFLRRVAEQSVQASIDETEAHVREVFAPPFSIQTSFSFCRTPEGHPFWWRLSEEFDDTWSDIE